MKWFNRIKLLKISSYVIVICTVLSVTFAGFTIYGDKVGNFVITVDQSKDVYLALSTHEDFTDVSSRLAAKGVAKQQLATYTDIPTDIADGLGGKNDADRKFLAYSFYLINYTSRDVDYSLQIKVVESTLNVDAACRVMVLENDFVTSQIYAKPQPDGSDPNASVPEGGKYAIVPFASEKLVADRLVENFPPGASVKYTVVLWLEGWDMDSTDAIQGGKLRLSLDFAGY